MGGARRRLPSARDHAGAAAASAARWRLLRPLSPGPFAGSEQGKTATPVWTTECERVAAAWRRKQPPIKEGPLHRRGARCSLGGAERLRTGLWCSSTGWCSGWCKVAARACGFCGVRWYTACVAVALSSTGAWCPISSVGSLLSCEYC